MNKENFLRQLYNALYFLNENERRDIMLDYEEHFRAGLDNGKTEEQISKELGDPIEIAKSYKTTKDTSDTKSNKTFGAKAIIITILLIFLNVSFILGIYLAAWGVLAGLFAGSVAVFVGGIASILGSAVLPFINLPNLGLPFAATVFLGIGLMSLSVLWFIGNCFLVKYLILGTKAYINWNIEIVNSCKEA